MAEIGYILSETFREPCHLSHPVEPHIYFVKHDLFRPTNHSAALCFPLLSYDFNHVNNTRVNSRKVSM